MQLSLLAMFNLGGGEIILIMALLAILIVPLAVVAGVIFLIIHLTRKKDSTRQDTYDAAN